MAGRLAAGLRSARYRVIAQQEGLVHGVRGEAGFFGSIAFHLGLLLVLAGVVASSLTRVNGEVVLTEGFPVAFTPASMLSLDGGDRFPARAAADSLSIRDFVAEYSPQGTPVDYSLLLSVHRGGERIVEEQVRVNQPFRWQGFQITLHRFGFAPELAARDPSGRLRQDAVTVLQLLPPGRPDTVPLEGGGSLKVRLFPDLAMKGARPQTRSLRPARPVAFFEWQDEAGRTVASGQVERGSEVDAGGYRLAFRSLSYWAGFVVARDRGLWFFVVGSVLGSAGILARLVLPDQTVRIEWGDGRARLLASTRFFPALHREEIARLVRSLEEASS